MSKKSRKRWRKLLTSPLLYATVLLAAAVIVVSVLWRSDVVKHENQQQNAVTATEVLKGFEVASLTFRYTNVVSYSDVMKLGPISIPGTSKYLAVKYDGIIKMGVDASRLSVSLDGYTVTLPHAEILSHEQVPDSLAVLIDDSGIFVDNEVAEYVDLFKSEMKSMEAKAVESGMLDEAEASAAEQILSFLNSFPDLAGKVTVKFETVP
jgi:hypothetical protein